MRGGSEAEALGDGGRKEGWIMFGIVNRGEQGEGLRSEEVRMVEERELVGALVAEDYFFGDWVSGGHEGGGHGEEIRAWVDRFERGWSKVSGFGGGGGGGC